MKDDKLEPGDEVLVHGVVTRVRGDRVSVAFRVANRLGSTYPGSSTTNKLINGEVRRVTEVPEVDIADALK